MRYSFIIPMYNSMSSIEKCVCSIQQQNFKDLEIILVDDGSEDKTIDVVYNMMKSDSRIKLYTVKHSGVSSARNCGLYNSKGEYIIFVDADDYIAPEFLSVFEEKIAGNPNLDVVACSGYQVFGDEKRRIKTYSDVLLQGTESVHFYSPYYYGSVWGKAFHRRALKNKKGEDILFNTSIYYSEDELWLCEILLNSKQVLFIPNCLYYYVVNKDSASHVFSGGRKFTRYVAWDKIVGLLKDYPLALDEARGKKFENSVLLFREMVGNSFKGQELEIIKQYVRSAVCWYKRQPFKNNSILFWYYISNYVPFFIKTLYIMKGKRS